jgi:hypothetical protein
MAAAGRPERIAMFEEKSAVNLTHLNKEEAKVAVGFVRKPEVLTVERMKERLVSMLCFIDDVDFIAELYAHYINSGGIKLPVYDERETEFDVVFVFSYSPYQRLMNCRLDRHDAEVARSELPG